MGHAEMVYSEDYLAYNFGEGHPFNPLRLKLTYDLMTSLGLPLAELTPRLATLDEIQMAHGLRYIQAVTDMSLTGTPTADAHRYGLGTEDNPVFRGMHEAASFAVGGSLVAAERIAGGQAEHVLNFAGGLHHAAFDHASGFCVYNDAVIAIRYLRAMTGWRVLYLDVDAHHGDGVQAAFYEDPNVVTISFHETGKYLFPGTGQVNELGAGAGLGYSLNVPLEPFTDDESWLECLMEVVPAVLARFRPDVLVTQHGCDGHAWDPLTDLYASTRFYHEVAQRVHQWAHTYTRGRWLALGGGGYDVVRVVPRAWTLLWMAMAGVTAKDVAVPKDWTMRWQPFAKSPMPSWLIDRPSDFSPIPRASEIREANRATVRRLKAASPLFV